MTYQPIFLSGNINEDIGGEIRINSEPGSGTEIEMIFFSQISLI